MGATSFVCPSGSKTKINVCLKQCQSGQRCMFLPTLRAVAESLDRKIEELATVDRPLSTGLERLEEMYKERYPLYAYLADFTVKVDSTPQDTAQKIIGEFMK